MSRLTGTDAKNLMEAYSEVYAPQELTEEQVWEEVENWVNSLLEEGYDLSDYTWEEMYEAYIEEAPMTAFQAGGGQAKLNQLNKGLSPRSGLRATPSTIERQGQDNLFKAGGGNAAIQKGPSTRQNTRGGRSIQVPSLTRQDIINRGTVAAAGGRPAATPAAPARPAPARPAPARPAPAAPAPRAAAPAARPAAAPARPATPAAGTQKPAPASTPAAPARPSLSSQAAEIRQMRARSLERQGKPLSAAVVSATAKPTAFQANSFDPFDVIKGHLLDEGYADTEESALAIMTNMSETWKEEILEGVLGEDKKYDRNRQRAAQRAAARNAARRDGKTGNVPGVGYVSPRPEGETYRDSAGVERHTSGARMPKKDS
jgi:hypothetical protein